MPAVSKFIRHHFRHFNAAALVDAAEGFCRHIDGGGKMFLTMAGAMSTGELGLSLAPMIRENKIHAICCTGANLEEDIFNLVAHDWYVRLPHYRNLTPGEEKELLDRHLNRVTDTCIPEDKAMRRVEQAVMEEWSNADSAGERFLPHEFIYAIIRKKRLEQFYEIDSDDSWIVAAGEKDLPLFVPGWEDSTLGNMYAAACLKKKIKNIGTVRSGIEYMTSLTDWYRRESAERSIGFFQIGGGIAGDFPICVVPLLEQDMELKNIPKWGYFCQISDSVTSYGSYSGAVPNEKITWGKLEVDTPKFIIESDASIVAPLIFAYVLGM